MTRDDRSEIDVSTANPPEFSDEYAAYSIARRRQFEHAATAKGRVLEALNPVWGTRPNEIRLETGLSEETIRRALDELVVDGLAEKYRAPWDGRVIVYREVSGDE